MAKIKKRPAGTQPQPAEDIRTLAHAAADAYRSYRMPVNTLLTVLVIAVIVAAVYTYSKTSKERQAGRMLDAAYSFYNPVGGAQLSIEKAIAGFQEVVKQYGGTVSGATAQYLIGNAWARMGRTEEALKAYDEFLQRHSGEKLLAAMVHQRRGYIFASQGRREDAVKAFGTAESLIGAGAATMELARIFEAAGNIEDARKKYKEVSEQLPATAFALDARAKLPAPDMKAPLSAPAGTK